jgi:hypothetical protein
VELIVVRGGRGLHSSVARAIVLAQWGCRNGTRMWCCQRRLACCLRAWWSSSARWPATRSGGGGGSSSAHAGHALTHCVCVHAHTPG